ncbi:Fe-Mn family superoxide dismutase [Paenibacillus cellulosilyticus]|uniref:superoxide dismutase n=1 Tax=Paenibacillus cellulosilyticus TaxID=375489 RepID=A0A2V2YPE6_9BACL|nr:Fe-Mn family superoxide dismutase [Paenibacillus cellulosilyticus]PWV97951.1 Fe-Mn family superoxide dismutase [Paenibacillus cellulosilyticus]
MLFVYGPQTPLRLLEEIRDWKRQEIEHAAVIRRFSPGLEQEYVWLLSEWEQPLRAAERVADKCLNEALTRGANVEPSDEKTITRAELLLQASAYQSQRFVEHLLQLLEKSPSLSANPSAKSFVLHAVRQSNGYLGVQDTYRYTRQELFESRGGPDDPFTALDSDIARKAGRPGTARTRPAKSTAAAPSQAPANSHVQAAEPASHAVAHSDSPAPTASTDDAADLVSEERAPVTQVPIGGHRLPPLPYAYNALEPYIDEMTMRIHHDKHHQSYVDGLNKAERELQQARQSGQFDLVKHWERELAFNGAGHYLHTLFWTVMAPQAGGQPSGSLANQIRQDFGSFEAFKKQFTEAANKVEGGGWAILVWSPRARRLEILTAEKHQNLSQWDVVPILPLDVWEHAYYLKHQNNRINYINSWWNVVNWPFVNQRFEQASKLIWEPF